MAPPTSDVTPQLEAVNDDWEDEVRPDAAEKARFSPDEEARLLSESNTQKSQANKLFTSSRYSEAIGEYDKALSSCPNYLDYECAVLKSNIAACHLKLEDWKGAVESATAALDALDRLQPRKKVTKGKEYNGEEKEYNGEEKEYNGEEKEYNGEEKEYNGEDEKAGAVVEIVGGDDDDMEKELAELKLSDERKEDIRRIRAKALMRRAKGRMEQGGWGNLAGAEEDYRELSKMSNLPAQDRKVVQGALTTLPSMIDAAKEKEMGEMMSKLKELGNGILKPFGLSTDMFKMNKDPATGGYNMAFEQSR